MSGSRAWRTYPLGLLDIAQITQSNPPRAPKHQLRGNAATGTSLRHVIDLIKYLSHEHGAAALSEKPNLKNAPIPVR
jgi:hypothetical protein